MTLKNEQRLALKHEIIEILEDETGFRGLGEGGWQATFEGVQWKGETGGSLKAAGILAVGCRTLASGSIRSTRAAATSTVSANTAWKTGQERRLFRNTARQLPGWLLGKTCCMRDIQGGKWRQGPAIARISKKFWLAGGSRQDYYEPFCGAIGSAYHAARAGIPAKRMHLSDANQALITYWTRLRDGWQPPLEVSHDTWLHHKEIQDPLDLDDRFRGLLIAPGAANWLTALYCLPI